MKGFLRHSDKHAVFLLPFLALKSLTQHKSTPIFKYKNQYASLRKQFLNLLNLNKE